MLAARERQALRSNGAFRFNARLELWEVKAWCALDDAGSCLLESAVDKLGLSARGCDRVLKVARTIADLDASESLNAVHVAEAIQYRSLDRAQVYWSKS